MIGFPHSPTPPLPYSPTPLLPHSPTPPLPSSYLKKIEDYFYSRQNPECCDRNVYTPNSPDYQIEKLHLFGLNKQN